MIFDIFPNSECLNGLEGFENWEGRRSLEFMRLGDSAGRESGW